MKINIGRAKGTRNNRTADVVGIAVLAVELTALAQLAELQSWFVTAVPSSIARVLVYALIFMVLAIWGLAIWPKIDGAISWGMWTIGFGAFGWLFLYLSIARNYGRGFSFIYGPCFIGQAMIGVAGLVRFMSMDFIRRMK